MNVPLDVNRKKILNIALDKNCSNRAATVKMVSDLETKLGPYTNNHVYREIFEEFFDLTDASNYKLTLGTSGITFTGINPNLTFPQRTISNVEDNGLTFQRKALNLTLSHCPNVTLCVVMQLPINRRFMIEFQVKNHIDRSRLTYDSTSKRLFMDTDNLTNHITLLNSFNGKKFVI